MNKLLNSISLLVTAGALSTLAGCELYFGDHNNNDAWNYCGSDGYYQCQGDNCEWVSSTCPDGSGSGSSTPGGTMGSGSNGSGYECGSNNDCAAGCYCTANGTCEEGGFCATDADCGTGYHCDTERSSCEPNPAASCAGAVTCNTAKPQCPAGSSPLIADGCYTGDCQTTSACDAPPVCENITDAASCAARSADCSTTTTGLNCTRADGSACQDGDTMCTCESYIFATCVTK